MAVYVYACMCEVSRDKNDSDGCVYIQFHFEVRIYFIIYYLTYYVYLTKMMIFIWV